MSDEAAREVGGWIRAHRSMQSHPVSRHNGMFRLWMYCIWLANWEDKDDLIPGTNKPIAIKRGQFITGRESLLNSVYGPMYRADDKPASKTLWRWLGSLQQLGCVKVTTLSNRCSIVTVLNYSTYQNVLYDDVQADGRDVSKSCPADGHADVPPMGAPVSTANELKKERTQEPKKGRSKSPAPAFDPKSFPIPEALNRQEFIEAWHAFIRHRSEMKPPKPITAEAATRLFKKFEKWGVEQSVHEIDRCIVGNWTGVFEDPSFRRNRPVNGQPGPHVMDGVNGFIQERRECGIAQ